jgi:hypothetical protein
VAITTSVGVILCLCLCIYVDGSLLPYKPCRPVAYPQSLPGLQHDTATTTDSLDTVKAFYDQRLNIQEGSGQLGVWVRSAIDQSHYSYTCRAIDLNFTTAEAGCITISAEGEGTIITTKHMRAEGSIPVC